ncbi:MAG TPA: DNA-binding domain-containing protein [Mycobacteriales bacterium]|nr:DNA-binding domain-containing protein [Mycobacteriales bacterium]
MADELDLVLVQRWMQGAILDPCGASPGARQILTGSGQLSAVERLGIYLRGYRLRLLDSFRGLHPALCQLLGPDLFEQFVFDYLGAYPSRSHTLFDVDNRFVDHLLQTRPDRNLPAEAREGWIDLIIDLAQFERIFVEVLEGVGAEDSDTVCLADLPREPDDAWLDTTLVAVPCLRLLYTRFPVHRYVEDVRKGRDVAVPLARATPLVVSRCDYVVVVSELEPDAYWLLYALVHGESVRTASRFVDIPQGWILLRDWVRRGFFTTINRDPVRGSHQPVGAVTASPTQG